MTDRNLPDRVASAEGDRSTTIETLVGIDLGKGVLEHCARRGCGPTNAMGQVVGDGHRAEFIVGLPREMAGQSIRLWLAFLVLGVASIAAVPALAAGTAVVAALEATQLSGTAPLAVLFDASGTTAAAGVLPFHQVTYSFEFGDERGQTWPVSGLPKNRQRGGPLAAHVFDAPGTYVVSVRAQAPDGTSSNATVAVTVQDPNVVYAGRATVCVSTSNTFTGCPTGAARQTSIPNPLSGKRVLLRRGESFEGINPRNTDSGFQIGAFGEGPKPAVTGVSTGMIAAVASWASNFTVMDLEIGTGGVNIDATTSRFLLYRNDIKSPGQLESMVNVGTAAGYYQSHNSGPVPGSIYWPREVFLVENDIQGRVDATRRPNLVVMGFFYKSALMGNTIDRATEHSLRVWAASKLVISHNRIGGNHYAPSIPGIRSAVKIHSGGVQAFTSTIATSLQPATSQVILANNDIGSTTFQGSWLTGIAPQNADRGTVEGIEDFVAEANRFIRGPHTSSEMQVRGKRVTARGNTLNGGGKPDIVRNGSNFDLGLNTWDGPYFLQ